MRFLPVPGKVDGSISIPSSSPPGDDSSLNELLLRQRIINSLPLGNTALSAPNRMFVKDTKKVELRVGFNAPLDLPDPKQDENTQTVTGESHVSAKMMAILDGDGAFDIKSTSPDIQMISPGIQTLWTWNVTALTSGNHDVEAKLYVMLKSDNNPQLIKSYKQSLIIDVASNNFFEKLSQLSEYVKNISPLLGAIAAILTPIFVFFGIPKWFKRKINSLKRNISLWIKKDNTNQT